MKNNIQESNTLLVDFRKLVKDTEKKRQCLNSLIKQKQRTFKTK